MDKLIVILGPTASGKSALAVKLARLFNGEVVSADSRQVYKGLNVGSGKVTKSQMRGIPHHLLDIANPKNRFTVAQYQKLALAAIKKIQKKGKLPFLVGGTGFYIQSVVDEITLPEVKPNWKLRRKLEKKSAEELFLMLKKIDPARTTAIDSKNPRRLVRALEIAIITGKPIPPLFLYSREYKNNILQIGIKKSPEELKKAIQKRLLKRIKGIILEVKNLHNPIISGHQQKISGNRGVSWKRLEEFGLEYRFVAQYLQNKPFGPAQGRLNYQQMLDKIQKESEHFTKRQMTWFKRDKRIYWVTHSTSLRAGQKEVEKLIRKFL